VRIVLVNNYARVTGGADIHCLELAKGLRERGHEVAFIATANKHNIDQQGAFVPTIVTRATRSEMTGARAAQVACLAIWNPSTAATTKNLLGSFRADIVHAHKLYPQLSVVPIVVAASRRIPIVQTVHDYEFISASSIDDTGDWRDRDEERTTYRALNTVLFAVKRLLHTPRVDRWISVSRSTAAAYHERGIDTTVLPNFTEPFVRELPRFEERKGVLFVGRLAEEKGIRHILDLPTHLPKHPIAIAGDGPLAKEVARAAHMFPSLTYLGKLDSKAVAQQIASARLVVMPSQWREPGPLAALEAMAAGTPLIAYDNGGLAEYVMDAGAGIVVPPSTSSMADAISSIYDDRARWENFSASARDAIQRQHTLPRYLDRLEQVYTEAISLKDHLSPSRGSPTSSLP
jgi:glycosyltransferase involved in cell wall biosynthesis